MNALDKIRSTTYPEDRESEWPATADAPTGTTETDIAPIAPEPPPEPVSAQREEAEPAYGPATTVGYSASPGGGILQPVADPPVYTSESDAGAADSPVGGIVQPVAEEPVPVRPDDEPLLSGTETAALQRDTIVLLNYALGAGKKVPAKIASLSHRQTSEDLIQSYQELAQLIRPAIPQSVLYLARQHVSRKSALSSKVPTVRGFMLVGICSFLLLVVCSSSPLVNEKNLAGGLLNNSGPVLMLNMLFISSISCLGAIFSILPKITLQIRQATYLPESGTYYWSMLLLGVFGGMIMGELLSIQYDIPETPVKFDAVVFSLMGGFASESVFLILKTLMSKVQQLLVGSAKDQAE